MNKTHLFSNTFMEEEIKIIEETKILTEINPEEIPLIKMNNDTLEYEGRIKIFKEKPSEEIKSILNEDRYIAFHSLISTVNYSNGHSYKGSWINGHVHGKGEYIDPKEFKYNGSWRNGLMDGWGEIEHLDDGLKYKGQFKKNLKHGLGTVSHDNEIIRGYFENDGLIKKISDYEISDEDREYTYY